MGALMNENSARLLGLYDELSAFLTQINLYRGRGLSDSHELALFLQLFNGHPWRRDTGTCTPHKSYSSAFINTKKQQGRKVTHLTKMIYQQCAVFTRLS